MNRGDSIHVYLSTDGTCDNGDTDILNTTAGFSIEGQCAQYNGNYNLNCANAGTHYWICAYDSTTGTYSDTVALGAMPGCIG